MSLYLCLKYPDSVQPITFSQQLVMSEISVLSTHTHYVGEYESVCMQVLECVCVRIAISALQSVETEIASDNRFDFSSVFMQISE